jgi:hypothetical protein
MVLSKSTDMVNHIGHNTSQDASELTDLIKALSGSLGKVGKVIRNYKGVNEGTLDIPTIHLMQVEPKAATTEKAAESTGKDELSESEKQNLAMNQEKVLDDQLRSLTTAIKELVIVNEEQPKKLSEQEAQQDPIKVLMSDLGCRTRVESGSIFVGVSREPCGANSEFYCSEILGFVEASS